MAMTYRKSKSGYYAVQLNAVFPHEGFDYKPGTAITVGQTVLDAMIAADVVTHVAAA